MAEPGAFGGITDYIYVNAILPRTSREPWTAVGYVHDIGGSRNPKIWTSADGKSWADKGLPRSPTGHDWESPWTATRHGESIAVLGIQGEQRMGGAVAWYRDGPGQWSVIPDDLSLAQRIGGIGTGPEGIVVVGVRESPVKNDIVVLRSEDGTRWTASLEPGARARKGELVDAIGYAAVGRREVIVGQAWPTPAAAATNYNFYDGAIWWSNGDRWNRVAGVPAQLESTYYEGVADVVAFRGGFVAVGTAEGSHPSAWVSRDGRAWSRHTIEVTSAHPHQVAVVGEGMVAVGVTHPGRTLAVWSSKNGRRWSRVSLPAEMTQLDPVERAAVTGGPGGEVGIVVHDDIQSEAYIGRP